MKQIIPMDEYGIFADSNDTARADSRFVAQYFEKKHFHVLRDIEKITDTKSGLSEEFIYRNFKKSTYKDTSGKNNICYLMTRDGFTMLVMGYTGAKAMEYKERYIKRFNKMEKFIQTLIETRKEYPLLTAQIKLLHDDPKPYHYSNESDMLNRFVIGMSSKKFKELNHIPKNESIRPYLTEKQIKLMDILQKVDIGLMVSEPNYEKRKRYLEWYLNKLDNKKLAE